MDKKQLRKNRLDLEYRKYTQILNGVFIFATTGLLGFIGTFVWSSNFKKLLIGISISFLIMFTSFYFYKKVNYKLSNIFEQILNIIEEK